MRKRNSDRIKYLEDSHKPTNVADHLRQRNKMATALPPITVVAVEIIGLPNITGAIVGKVGALT